MECDKVHLPKYFVLVQIWGAVFTWVFSFWNGAPIQCGILIFTSVMKHTHLSIPLLVSWYSLTWMHVHVWVCICLCVCGIWCGFPESEHTMSFKRKLGSINNDRTETQNLEDPSKESVSFSFCISSALLSFHENYVHFHIQNLRSFIAYTLCLQFPLCSITGGTHRLRHTFSDSCAGQRQHQSKICIFLVFLRFRQRHTELKPAQKKCFNPSHVHIKQFKLR